MKRKKDNENNVVECLIVLGIGATIGALIGSGLSFTALSPLIMGGITAAVPVALLACLIIFDEEFSKRGFFLSVCFCAASAAIGVGLAAAATAIFPGVMLGMGSAALTGALIAPIAIIAGVFAAAFIIEPIAEKVNEYIISPIVEKLENVFLQKEKSTI